MVKALVMRDECAMHTGLDEVVSVLFKADALDPFDDSLVGPYQHICKLPGALFSQTVYQKHASN